MRLYNLEIFNRNLEYKSSFQVSEIKYNMDYLAIGNSNVKVKKIEAEEGDYIRITGPENCVGIVTSCQEANNGIEVQFKPMLALTDVTVHFDKDSLKTESLEEWLAAVLNATFRENEDHLQNITGFEAVAIPGTYGAILSTEENIDNLYTILTEALVKYSVSVEFVLDVNEKKVTAVVAAQNKDSPVIEADLPNILDKLFMLKQADKTVNKLSVYNRLNEEEHAEYYMLYDGTITTDSTAAERITPVIWDTVYIEHEAEETFAQKAYEKAFCSLQLPDYNNLIELTVISDDSLIQPRNLQIGQKVRIIKENKIYHTVLTGKNVERTTKLIFGAVRLELTKTLKRRMR